MVKLDVNIGKKEAGKILIVSSLLMMVASIYGFYTMQNLTTEMSQASEEIQNGLDYVESEETQRIRDALGDNAGLTEQFNTLEQGYQNAEQALNQTQKATEEAEKAKTNYQWMTLTSFMLLISGIVLYLV